LVLILLFFIQLCCQHFKKKVKILKRDRDKTVNYVRAEKVPYSSNPSQLSLSGFQKETQLDLSKQVSFPPSKQSQ